DSMVVYADESVGVIDGPQPEYHPAEDRTWDLLHTMLDLSFDWNNSTVIGTATLTLSPLFYPQSELRLDAVNFSIRKILVNAKPFSQFTYDSNEIVLQLPQPMTRREKLTVAIEYIAHPRPDFNDQGAAISNDQGLFFIDPLDTVPGLPRQIWTQGETSSNRKWFPTIDQPNERGTQEIFMTVADTFMTLSNGALLSSTKLSNGMRRDHWKLELPHAPYLAMVAVGIWDKVSDTWRGRPVDYYVDPGYGPSAREIFAHTPEMISFFSDKLGVDFVWPKYAQVVVKEFVSGAMENTTAVTFGEFVQFNVDDMIESGANDYIVSHELFHHWFGDLVTLESWANLTLNEGFANYAEYLWAEYKYGRDKAGVQRMGELRSYFEQASYDAHPLIYYRYPNEGAMFDAHSYNKGGLVLHMLRDQVGDEAFFASLRLYLQRHAYSAVEADDLRQAFEEITGTDLQWFFDQWFFEKGHPVLDIKQRYDETANQLVVDITQVQHEQDFFPNFRLPIEVATYDVNGKETLNKFWLRQKAQSFTIDLNEKPVAVVFDPRDILLAVVNQEIPESEYLPRLIYPESISHRISAFRVMTEIPDNAIEKMIIDSSVTIRALAIQYLASKESVERLYQIALTESNLDLRYYILQEMMELDPVKAKLLAEKMLETTTKNPVVYDALMAIAKTDLDAAILQATRFQNNPSPAIYAAQAGLYARKGTGINLEFFKTDRAKNIPIDYLEEFITALALYLSKQEATVQQEGIDLLKSTFYLNGPIPEYRRFYLITGLMAQYTIETNQAFKNSLQQTIKYIYEQEKDDYLKEVLREGFGSVLE
ncbi:MAG: DUF3458 domain-containing protein, partial [Saprospiraceae bacterium]